MVSLCLVCLPTIKLGTNWWFPNKKIKNQLTRRVRSSVLVRSLLHKFSAASVRPNSSPVLSDTPSIFIHMSYEVYPKLNLSDFDQFL